MDLLIGDVLELARLESGGFELDREQLDWAEPAPTPYGGTRPLPTGRSLRWRPGTRPG
jgi:hypothetical protein